MGHIERGEKNVSFNTLVRLAQALGIALPELLSEVAAGRKAPAKTTGKRNRTVDANDLGGLARELLQQRANLDQAAGVLTDVANALRLRQRSLSKRRER